MQGKIHFGHVHLFGWSPWWWKSRGFQESQRHQLCKHQGSWNQMIKISYKKMLTNFHATFHFQRKYCCFEITKPFLTVAQETKWLLSKSDWTYLAAIFCRKWKCDSVVLSNLSVRNPRVFSYDWLLAAYPNFTCSGYVIIGLPLFHKSCLTD